MTNLAGGSVSGVDVELSARLAEQLAQVALGIVSNGTDLADDLSTLVSTLTSSISGYAGLRLTIVHTGQPVQVTALPTTDRERTAVTSLRVPLPPISSELEDGGRLVIWSTVPGSLVDLGADLAFVLRRTVDGSAAASSVVELDVDLPLPPDPSGVDGLDELATIHRAAGLLIERGDDPASVHATLRARASADGLTSYAWADRLLRLH